MKKKAHLMLQTAPFAWCGMRLKDYGLMVQVFSLSKTTCMRCRLKYKKIKKLFKEGKL